MSGPTLPRLGMGTAGLGNLYEPVSNEVARTTLEAAWAADIRYFDTAPHYGFGLAERRLGQALEDLDLHGQAIVSTKVGRLLEPTANPRRERHGFVDADPYEPVFDYGRDAVLRSHAESLRRLRRARVDILLAHDLGELTHGANNERHMHAFLDGGYRAMRDLKDSGAVGAIGIGVNEVEVCLFLLERVELDVILLAGRYTLLDCRAGDELLPLCQERGVGVIVGGPYNSGILAQPTARQRDPHYDYDAPSAAILTRAAAIERLCDEHGVALGAAALQFPLRHPAVISVIPGLVGQVQVREAVERVAAEIPAAIWPELADIAGNGEARPAGKRARLEPKLILLDDSDDVFVCIAPITAGDRLAIDGTVFRAAEDIGVGHKVARRAIWPGAKIRKYGLPIGSATTTIAAGEWVHAHNMRSDYIPSHSRETVAQGQSR
jgi:D-threo-aldose 1-dehydrogenase